ncbi:hypothetical protein P3W45_000863 [Vairimorpha bombi]|jgi:hypothetical protein
MTEADIQQAQTVELHITPSQESKSKNADLFCYKDKRKGVIWTEEEELVLREGIRRFGKGNWTKILSEYKDDFDSQRRYRDLSDKIRNCEKTTSYSRRVKRDFWEVDSNDDPILNKMGEPVIFFCKLPFEAATKVAYSKNYAGGDHIIRICYEEAGQNWYHVYNARYDKTARKCVRLRKIAGQSLYRTDGM